MSNLAKGKYAKAISDRSGMEFPYQRNGKRMEWLPGACFRIRG